MHKLIEVELFKLDHAADQLRDQDQARLELETNVANNFKRLESLEGSVVEITQLIQRLIPQAPMSMASSSQVTCSCIESPLSPLHCILTTFSSPSLTIP